MPQVSIVLPTYNGARYLREAVDSVLGQRFDDFELIVVVDGSTDETASVLAGYRDPRVRVIYTENQGLPRALNTGFAAATAPLLSWTSDDNSYLPEAFQVMVDYLAAHPQVAMVCTDCLVINEAGATTGYSRDSWACFVYRAEAAQKAGPYRPEYRLVEDVDFFLRLRHYGGPIERIAAPHYCYRVHSQSLSAKQLSQRHLISLKLHYELTTRGIETLDLRELFVDRLCKTAMHGDSAALDEILDFARSERVRFLRELEWRHRLLNTRLGWLYNRVQIALMSRLERLRSRVSLG